MEQGTHTHMGRGRAWLAAAAFVAALLAPGIAPAAPLVYAEAVDGDLGRDGQGVFELDIGANRVSGDARFIAWMGGRVDEWQFDSDHFYFTIPARARVERIFVSWATEVLPGTEYFVAGVNWMALEFDEETWDTTLHAFHTVEFDVHRHLAWTEPFHADLPSPAAANVFRLFMFTHAAMRSPPGQWGGGSVRYGWQVDVSRVPEPGTLALSTLGLFGLLALRLRAVVRHSARRRAQRIDVQDSRAGR